MEVATAHAPASVARLAGIPWRALAGLAPALDGPLAEVLAGGPADAVLDRLLRSRRALSRVERRVVAEAVFGVALWRRRLAHHAGKAALPRTLLACLLRDLAEVEDAEAICGLPEGSLPPRVPPPPAVADFFSLPDWLGEVLWREAGARATRLADALNLPGPVFIRANRARVERDALAARLAEEGLLSRQGRFAPDALEVVSPRPNVLALPSYREGLFEVQDEGSQLAGEAVGAEPGDRVLDLCAGAGGKALLLAAALRGRGEVCACDVDAARLDRLARRAARARAAVRVGGAAPPAGTRFDRVLVDAPCSALGALRRGPGERFRIDPGSFAALPALQLDLLLRGAAALRPGGRIVYATCTLRSEENEDVAIAFERARPDLRRVPPIGRAELLDGAGFMKLRPDLHGTDGFFVAAWQSA